MTTRSWWPFEGDYGENYKSHIEAAEREAGERVARELFATAKAGHRERFAKERGYFWLPCSVCGENFSGAEASDVAIWTGHGQGEIVCPKQSCKDGAVASNMTHPEWQFGRGVLPGMEDHWT